MSREPQSLSDEQERAIISEEYQGFLHRCEARGIPEYVATSKLFLQFLADASTHHNDALMERPGSQQLIRAHELWTKGVRTGSQWNEACADWLFAASGAKIGDVVEAYGWANLREILVQHVDLSWNPDDKILDGRFCLHGPFYQRGTGFKLDSLSSNDLTYTLYKVEPSSILRRYCTQHGIHL